MDKSFLHLSLRDGSQAEAALDLIGGGNLSFCVITQLDWVIQFLFFSDFARALHGIWVIQYLLKK